jgi:hypothetical protein
VRRGNMRGGRDGGLGRFRGSSYWPHTDKPHTHTRPDNSTVTPHPFFTPYPYRHIYLYVHIHSIE